MMRTQRDRPSVHRRLLGLRVLGLLVLSGITTGIMGCRVEATASTDSPTWQRLRTNPVGYVVLLRHAEAPGSGDPPNFRLDDCTTQRNLSPQGQTQARRIGQAFRQRQVAIAQVYSSQWCRCLETAELLQLGTVKPLPLLNSFFQNRQNGSRQTTALRQLIQRHRQTPGVLFLVTHQVNITEISGIVPPSGGAVVMKARDRGSIEVIGELPPP